MRSSSPWASARRSIAPCSSSWPTSLAARRISRRTCRCSARDFNRMLETLRRRYVISYTSTNSTRDGAWRKVEIRSSRSGVAVASRGGYFAPAK